ncbi:GroES-like protein [Cristinia sonorae]|uniref:GroES-like protein n=1 Tax=Cristinia sonorae TaxID=1940300 RepID=A0A8K0UF50_9AGAR|nr:GroES-like protein [Cristinia sonorae]
MTIPSQQQALAILKQNGGWGLITTDVDQPGPGEVLIRVEAAALNPADWKIQAIAEYSKFVQEYPAILGTDSAGVVVALGDGVTNVAVGDRVLHQGFFTNRKGTFKQYTIIDADLVAKIPDNLSFDQAATVPLALVTSAIGLYSETRLGAGLVAPWKEGGAGKYNGQPIVIFGGSSSLGQYALQLAKLSAFSPIITTVSPRNDGLVKSLGATHTIDRSLPADEVLAAVKRIATNPVKITFDAIAQASTQSVAYDILASGGTLVTVSALKIAEDKLTPDKKVVATYGSVHPEGNREFGRELFRNITHYLESGEIKPNPVEVLSDGLTGIVDGLKRIQDGKISGVKLVAHPQETVVRE